MTPTPVLSLLDFPAMQVAGAPVVETGRSGMTGARGALVPNPARPGEWSVTWYDVSRIVGGLLNTSLTGGSALPLDSSIGRGVALRWLEANRRQHLHACRPGGQMHPVTLHPDALRVAVLPHRHGGAGARLDGFCVECGVPEYGWGPAYVHDDFLLPYVNGKYVNEAALRRLNSTDLRTLSDGSRWVEAEALRVLCLSVAGKEVT